MKPATRRLFDRWNQHPGDRQRLFTAIGQAFDAATVLYPGSFIDIAPSFVFDRVAYVDIDRRAAQFFADRAGVDELIGEHRGSDSPGHWTFHPDDYTSGLVLPEGPFDLLVSLYAGFVSEHCTHYLRPGGMLLANPSHGDAAMAAVDARYRLAGAVIAHGGTYSVRRDELDRYLIPKRGSAPTPRQLHESGRGITYTRPAFAYVFEYVAEA